MRLILENINKIAKADIEFNGLTVIAGSNDSGKSTVGRALFSVVKALVSGLNNSERHKVNHIHDKFSSLYKRLLSVRNIDRDFIRKFFYPYELMKDVEKLLSNDDLSSFIAKETIAKMIEDRVEILNNLDIAPRHKSLALKDLTSVMDLLKDDDYNMRFKSEFQTQIESEFFYNLCSIDTHSSSIKFHSDNGSAEIKMKDNEIVTTHIDKKFDYSLTDATFVETPLYLHLMDVLCKSSTYKELESQRGVLMSGMVSVHIKDMITKLDYSRYFHLGQLNLFPTDQFGIEKIIGGHFVYDKKTRSLLLMKEKNKKKIYYSPMNVASGIKSFGVIQLLLEMGFIDETKILIWDEPENHLHPQWQIEFAHLLVKLAKFGIPVVVSSHSPYFIQGIRYFANEEKMDSYVNYYLAEENTHSGLSYLENVTTDLNQIFLKLAEPMNQIMNINVKA